jgi:2,4-dienoyl-CoA reductase-like NADH-dependent reductase (Old Yellow Enzyme family)
MPALLQLNHGGGLVTDPKLLERENYRSCSPSGIPVGPFWGNSVKRPGILYRDEIYALIEDFRVAAERAVRITGYSGVQIHCCHGHLLGQFLSPVTNKRSDEWGGNLDGRANFLYKVVEEVKRSLPETLLSVRLGASDYFPDETGDGLTIEDTTKVAVRLTELGVDIISVSGNLCGYGGDRSDPARFAPYALQIKKALKGKALVECTGGIYDRQTACFMLSSGSCDLVGIGRLILQDPKFLQKWRGEEGDDSGA